MDLSNSEKNGILLMEDPLEREWVPHFFVLTETKMSYTEVHQEENEPEEADEDQSDLSLKEVSFVLLILFYSFPNDLFFKRVFLTVTCISTRNGFTVVLQAVAAERKNCYFNMVPVWEMELFSLGRVTILSATFPYHFGTVLLLIFIFLLLAFFIIIFFI